MPRVLLVLHEDTLGGASRAVLRPLEALGERGWEVSVWCSRPSPLYDDLVAQGYDVAGAPRMMRYRIRSLRHPPGMRARLESLPRMLSAFRRELRARRPDLVHVNGRTALPEAFAARAARYPVAIYIHDAVQPGARGLVGRLAPWLAAREVLCVSSTHAASLRLPGREPRIVPPAPPPAPALVPARPGGARLVVGTIGVLSPRKGTDLFIDMAERLRAAGVDAEFRLAGSLEEGHHLDWGKAQAARAEVAGVTWLGQTDVARELAEWDVMVLPSRADPFPLAVLEAMQMGVPVVGTRVDGIAEQLAGDAGVLVEPDDAGALADAVRALAEDPARRAAIARRGRERVLANFTLEHTAAGLEAAWRATLAGAGRGAA